MQQELTCEHGSRVIKTGVSAKGPWKGAMCPLGKDDPSRCPVEWLKADDPGDVHQKLDAIIEILQRLSADLTGK